VLPKSRWGPLWLRCLMVVAMAAVPTKPEVFGILLYSFWWATLWPLIILGWTRSLWPLRAPLLAVAALSSPAGGAFFVVYALSYAFRRERRDLFGGAILLSGFVAQLAFLGGSQRAGRLRHQLTDVPHVLQQVLREFAYFGLRFAVHPYDGSRVVLVAGACLAVATVAAAIWLLIATKAAEPLLLVAGAFVVMVLSALPHPLMSDPLNDAARYYFLPFVALSWALLALVRSFAARRPAFIAAAALATMVLAVSVIDAPAAFWPRNMQYAGQLSWPRSLQQCARGELPKGVPVNFDGTTTQVFRLRLTPRQCAGYLGEATAERGSSSR